MASITVKRTLAATDRFGDPVDVPDEHVEEGARIAWAGPHQNAEHPAVISTQPVVYFRRRVPDIIRGDTLCTPDGAELHVLDVQRWEHARHEGVIAGTAIICREV